MKPSRPYFVRAVYEWLIDNEQTPFLLVDATRPSVEVPAAFVKEGRIVLNVAPGAVRDFFIRNEEVSFSARFGGVPMQIFVPMGAVLAIYSRENGQGMFFDEDDYPEEESATPSPDAEASGPVLAAVPAPTEGVSGDDEPPPKPGGGRPTLRVVK